MSILYILTTIALLTLFILIKKSNQKINVVSTIILTLIAYLGYNIAVCFVLGNINLTTNLLCLSIVNLVFIALMSFKLYKDKDIQRFYFNKRDIIGLLIAVIICCMVAKRQYTPLSNTIATASVDGSMHYSAATNFADNMKILSKIDNDTGYNFLTMQPGAYINNGILMNVLRGLTGSDSYDMKAFKLFEIGIYFLNILAFYMLISEKLNSKYKIVVGAVALVLYSYAFPFTSLVYGFSYLSVAILFIIGMIYLAIDYKERTFEYYINCMLTCLMGCGIIFSYCLFVPAMFAYICINAFIFDEDKKHKLFKKHTCILTGILLVVTVVAILYLVIPTFMVSDQNKMTDAISFDGQIYKELYMDFLIYIPFVVLYIYRAIKDRKMSPLLLAFLFVFGQFLLTLIGLLAGIVSPYYYYKIYYIIYPIIVAITVEMFGEYKENKELSTVFCTMFVIFILIILGSVTRKEATFQATHPTVINYSRTDQLAGIYFETNVFMMQNIRASCLVDENRVALANELGKIEGVTLKNLLVGGMNTNHKAWVYVLSKIPCGGESINDLQKAVVETSVKDFLNNKDKEYFILFTGDKFKDSDEFEVCFENDAGVILKKK